MQEEIASTALAGREHWELDLSPISNLQLTLEENGIVITGFDTVDRKIDAFIAIFKKTDNIVDALEKR